MKSIRKIINDPVYGYITIDHPLLLEVISHPYYQRLRRIHQMAFAQLVYPGAVHTRLHHSLGAYHLMSNALAELRGKGFSVSAEEDLGAKIAILLHDAGHGPYSHALENILVGQTSHEEISLLIMKHINEALDNRLQTAIEIFTNHHPKLFLHQLVSGQLDVDRMDYLSRDSFFTGVAEGVIGYDRILKMLTVHDGQLMVEEKAIYSIEKFLISRRLMYWQVYLHKAVVSAEMMLVKIIERARYLLTESIKIQAPSAAFDFFLRSSAGVAQHLGQFCELDDYDVMSTIKAWTKSEDRILSLLCQMLVNRQLFKVKLQTHAFDQEWVEGVKYKVCRRLNISESDGNYFVFTGEAMNTMYNPLEEHIKILFKDGTVRDISSVDNPLIHHTLSSPVKKNYICFFNNESLTSA